MNTESRPWQIWALGAVAAVALALVFWLRPARSSKTILVYVIGEVHSPGVVSVPEGSRLVHAIEKAGGLTTQADPQAINLAAKLSDEEKVLIPSRSGNTPKVPVAVAPPTRGPDPPMPPPVPPVEAETTPVQDRDHWEGGVVVGEEPGSLTEGEVGPRVSVNRATVEELEAVPGIGPELAHKIVAFRQGPPARGFSTLEDLTEIPGIKERKLEQLRAYIDL